MIVFFFILIKKIINEDYFNILLRKKMYIIEVSDMKMIVMGDVFLF